jgi:SAM-dependent methyltransferase
MPLNQMSEHFNDAFEIYFPRQRFLERACFGAANLAVLQAFRWRQRLFRGELLVNERIVEYPIVLRWIKESGRVLDIGCVSSRLPVQLASLGYEVHALDTRDYRFTHPNLTFHRADLFRWTPAVKYDVIVLVSVLEHFGLGAYGDAVAPEGDKRAINLITQWLAPGGQLLVSVPFGVASQTPKYRIYDSAGLRRLFGDLQWVRERYFARREGAWLPGDPSEIETIASPELPVNGVAILDARAPQ